MRTVLLQALLISLFLGVTSVAGLAVSDHEMHTPAGSAAAATSSMGMMDKEGMGMGQMPGLAASASGSMMPMMHQGMGNMMGAGMSGMMGNGNMGRMMEQRADHAFFLDRAGELGLSAEQVSELKTLQVDCRKDNIRVAAEVKIARLELSELLADGNWSLKDAEALVRKVQTLEGDIQVRHLQALSAARKVLTDEQLKQAQAAGGNEHLESLFQ